MIKNHYYEENDDNTLSYLFSKIILFYYNYYVNYHGNLKGYNYICADDEDNDKFVEVFLYVFDDKVHCDFDNKYDNKVGDNVFSFDDSMINLMMNLML